MASEAVQTKEEPSQDQSASKQSSVPLVVDKQSSASHHKESEKKSADTKEDVVVNKPTAVNESNKGTLKPGDRIEL